MNFISGLEAKDASVELKYCERCGGLWLRPQGGTGVYCPSCCLRLATLPGPNGRRALRPRNDRGKELQGVDLRGPFQIESLLGVAEMEVEP